MVTKVLMPKLSLAMKEGTVVQWFKREGDQVKKGEPLVEVLSEKVTYEVEAPTNGILRKILVEEGVDVPVAGTLAFITAPEEELPTFEVPEVAGEGIRRILASPAAKRLARERGVDLALVEGTGPDGRIVEEDVKRFVDDTVVLRRVREVIPLTGIRKTAADRVSLSARKVPHSTITMEVDMSKVIKLREEIRVTYTDIIVKAVAKALLEHSIMNSTLKGEEIRVFEDVNIGVAVATEKGLVVPVIHNADKKSITEISSMLKGLAEKVRQGKLAKDEMTGGTFTITNLGMFGVDVFTPIINPPETAILGVGGVAERPVVMDKEIVVRPTMSLSLSFDHRIVDGAPAAQFLQKIKQILERPSKQL